MKTYIALLRGINVSGQKKIKMAELKTLFEALLFTDVQTYIQSGNVIFMHDNAHPEGLERSIRQKILEKYGFEVAVTVLSPSELRGAIAGNPFLKDPSIDLKRIYVTFLASRPLPEHIETLGSLDYSPEAYMLDGKVLYFFSPHGYGKAKLNNNYIENKLKLSATTRNWKTVNTLMEMASGQGSA